MNNKANNLENQQKLSRLLRAGSKRNEAISVVKSPGARAAGWAVKVKSNTSHNFYNVAIVEIGDAGSLPVEISGQLQAVNLAESFLQTGQLVAGTYVAMTRAGNKYVFYAPV